MHKGIWKYPVNPYHFYTQVRWNLMSVSIRNNKRGREGENKHTNIRLKQLNNNKKWKKKKPTR